MIRLPKKLVLIGIDGLDPHLLSQLHDVLPNFTALEANGLSLPLRSVFPPDVSTKIEPELNTLHVVSCMESSALRCLPDYASHQFCQSGLLKYAREIGLTPVMIFLTLLAVGLSFVALGDKFSIQRAPQACDTRLVSVLRLMRFQTYLGKLPEYALFGGTL